MTKKITDLMMQCSALAVLVAVVAGCGMFSPSKTSGTGGSTGGTGWKVWVKTSPCAGGRTDWISVAKINPTEGGGGSFWQTADLLTSPLACTVENSCTFATAQDAATKVRPSSSFSKYCCRDYSVWKNTQTGEFTIVKGQGSAGFGWQFENLCCEEAEDFAGKPGVCSGTRGVSGWKTEENIDRPGGDYQDFDLSSPNIELCRKSCEDDPNCKAFTYAKPGSQGAKARCWLKNIVPQPMTSTCCTSGVKETSTTAPPIGPRRPKNDNSNTGGDGDNSNGKHDGVIPTPTPNITQTPQPGIGRWTLVSVTAIPETPPQGYSYNTQSASVHYDVYNGNTHDFQWTKPPAQFDANGFTVALNTQCKPIPKNGCASLMGVRSDGLESDTPSGERKAEANGADGTGASGQKSVTFKPTLSSPNEIEVEVGLMWGAARFIYKYRRE
jgi:hypothetical protein